jgi:CDP-4-dehydro-6-deoxyglucose reductase, E1
MANLDQTLSFIRDASEAYCSAANDTAFNPENPVVRLHEPTFGADEISAFVECMLTTRVTAGPKVKEFERAYASTYEHAHGVLVNSGSSANLLAIATLTNSDVRDHLKPGDEVIVPALSWSTTVWPLIQCGLIPVIVDIDPATLNIDPNEIERAIGPKTRGLVIVPVYGNPCDMSAVTEICNRNDLILIEDTCEAMGATYGGRPLGGFGRIGTFSFYFSHHITTLEGGICVTDDFEISETMRILRAHGWLRDVEDRSPWTTRYPEIDEKFLFVNLGYNLRISEPQAAMGLVQLDKLGEFVDARRDVAEHYRRMLASHDNILRTQTETPLGRSSCFGFPMVKNPKAGFRVSDITRFLNAKGIETRPIICGNIARQPAMKRFEHRVVGDLRHASEVMDCGFSVGNHQAISETACQYVADCIDDFIAKGGDSRLDV